MQAAVYAEPQLSFSQSQDFTYLVVAKDFTRHRVTLRYTGETWQDISQSGSAAKGLKLTDTRECHWSHWNIYRNEHVQTINATSGVEEVIAEPLKLQQAQDYPLYAPYVSEWMQMGAEIAAWVDVDRLKRIFNEDDYKPLISTIPVVGKDIKGPVGNVAEKVIDLADAMATITVSMTTHMTGFRKGPNCGEAKSEINTALNSYHSVMQTNMGIVPKAEYYLNSVNLYKYWGYRDPVSGQFVGALIVYPNNRWPDHLVASIKIWREIRQKMLGNAKNYFNPPAPTEVEIKELRNLISNEPDTWIETTIANYSKFIDNKMLESIKTDVAGHITATLATPSLPKPSDYLVVYREYPAQLSAEYLNADAKTRAKVDNCGHGGLYLIEFVGSNMSMAEKGTAGAQLSRMIGNQLTNVWAQMSRLHWIADRLPREHPLRVEIEEFATEILPQSKMLSDLGNVYNPRNVLYRDCLSSH